MTEDEIASEFAQAMLNREIDYCMKERPEKMARFTPQEQEDLKAKFLADRKEYALKEIAKFKSTDELLKMHRIGSLHPSNKNTRKMFEQWSGKKLPPSPGATEGFLKEFIGAEIVDAYYARREADEKAAEKAKADAENARALARLADLATKVSNDQPIDGHGMVDLAKWLGIELHPRTIGAIRDRVNQIQQGKALLIGRRPLPDTVWKAYYEVVNAVHLKGF